MFSHCFFKYSFSPTCFLLSFWDSSDMNFGSFVIVLHVLRLCHSPHPPDPQWIFLSVVLIVKFYCSILKFTNSILLSALSYSVLPASFLLFMLFYCLCYVVFNPITFIWFLFFYNFYFIFRLRLSFLFLSLVSREFVIACWCFLWWLH